MKNMQAIQKKRFRIQSQNTKMLRDCVLALTGGYILSGASLLGQALPLAACLIAALPLGLPSVAAVLGALVGYFTRCSAPEAVELSALSLLMLGTLVIFQGTNLPLSAWFMPVMSAAVCAILGAVRLLGTLEVTVSLWCSKWLLAGVCTDGFRKAVRGKQGAVLVLAAAVVAGLASFDAYIDLGFLLAVALSCASRELLPAVAFGVALDISGLYAPCATIALSLPALLCHVLHARRQETRALSYLLFPMTVLLFFNVLQLRHVLGISLGALTGFVLYRFQLLPRTIAPSAQEAATSRLEEAAQILDTLCGQLPTEKPHVCETEAEQVFDAAAERVCRCCARFHCCWQNRASETYQNLSAASIKIMERGVAHAEDFSQAFQESCCHLGGFVTAVNQELEGMLFRRRYRIQLSESRRVLSEEYGCVAQYLRGMSEDCSAQKERLFTPRVSICCASKDGGKVNGDKGACFAGPNASYYVLLCDGMGTGEQAAQLSSQAVHLLERLLKSGLTPEAALKLFNGSILLRGSSAFSTVDLLYLDLHTGIAELYKWGAAPSYWRNADEVKKIGTAAPPPGVGMGGENLPERYKLSLKRGELLVLISDGAYGEETETAISSYRDVSPQELAALLIAGMEAEDDMTAIVISLRPRAS